MCALALPAGAGLGPQNVALVVNQNSVASVTLANEYVRARGVPPGNVIFIDLPKEFVERIGVDDFRRLILQPVCDAIRDRGLVKQIDCVLYSADFPHGVDVVSDLAGRKADKFTTTVASINGLTYLCLQTLRKDLAYLSLNINLYAPAIQRNTSIKLPPPRGFRRTTGWKFDGTPLPGSHPEIGYMLSTVLGVTAGRGNTVDEVVQMIRRSVAADGTAPKGTIYFSINDDIRSKTRQWAFVSAAGKLKELGIRAEIAGELPSNKKDVMGAVVGVADFNWGMSGSTLLPGAIAEHLTSTGGVMLAGGGQTPISAWIRAGAAGTSGTVTEPYAIQEKFPTPFVHYYYAAGCTLAEAFYQSVSGPYQLLIIGDPLCRPWGVRPDVRVNLEPGQVLKGAVNLEPRCETAGFTVDRYEFFVDGRLHSTIAPGKGLALDTRGLNDGWHEFRIVAVGADGIQTQGHHVTAVTVDNEGRRLDVNLLKKKVETGQEIELQVSMAGAQQIVVTHMGREVGRLEGAQGSVKIGTERLGRGSVTLGMAAIYRTETGERRVAAPPVSVEITGN